MTQTGMLNENIYLSTDLFQKQTFSELLFVFEPGKKIHVYTQPYSYYMHMHFSTHSYLTSRILLVVNSTKTKIWPFAVV